MDQFGGLDGNTR